ncbi:MAG: HD domain-containing protein [Lentisphaeria bacterium]|nr:HD domain-containing protein [Lentisphaeria bacterium]
MTEESRQLAVIDLGTTSIRLAVATVTAAGTVRIIDRLQQNVTLGYDTFRRGHIPQPAVEDCMDVLRLFTERLREYRIPPDRDHLRVVATSAVREASNRDAVIDRIYIATGLEVDVVAEAELSRFTYLGILPFLEKPAFGRGRTALVVEVGGGSTELLAVRNHRVLFSQAHQLGALRLWQQQESEAASVRSRRPVMEAQIGRVGHMLQARLASEHCTRPQILAMGGDARFAASRLQPGWDCQRLARLTVSRVRDLANDVFSMSEDDLVRRFYLSYPEAETLGPALLTYVHLAQVLGCAHVYVTDVSMRDGVLAAMAGQQAMTEDFRRQVLDSAVALGNRYGVDQAHVSYVSAAACMLFDAVQAESALTPRHRFVLQVAGMLHEIGMYISSPNHNRHSMYLIANSDIFGLSSRDRMLAALVACYHRGPHPHTDHAEYAALSREQRIEVLKLAAILRAADALDRSHVQRLRDLRIVREKDGIRFLVSGVGDVALERMALEEKAELFEQVYGLQVRISPAV